MRAVFLLVGGVVFFVDDVDAIPLERLGPTIENDAVFADRVNVNVARVEGEGAEEYAKFIREVNKRTTLGVSDGNPLAATA